MASPVPDGYTTATPWIIGRDTAASKTSTKPKWRAARSCESTSRRWPASRVRSSDGGRV